MSRIIAHLVTYSDEGREVQEAFRDRRDAEKLKKIKKGKVNTIYVNLRPIVEYDKQN